MASPETLDFSRLLAPISDEAPAGPSLRDDPSLSAVYYQVKDAREAARGAERRLARAKWVGEEDEVSGEHADWRKVSDLAINALSDTSKDLWVAAWLIEALVRRHGFAGLRDGYRLVRELCERYWEVIHPRPDEDGYATTVAQLTGLNGDDSEGALIAPIHGIPITQGTSMDPLTGADYIDASELEQIADAAKREKRKEQGAVSLEMFDQAVRETPPAFFRDLMDDIRQAIQEFAAVTDLLEERCRGEDGRSQAPPCSAIRNALQTSGERLESIARHVLAEEGETSPGEGEEGTASVDGQFLTLDGQPGAPSVEGKLQTREDAFRALLRVAEYFRRTEPHSPVSYALKQAVRWGRMSLPELMSELVSDEKVRDDIFRRTGITVTDSDGSD